MTQQVGVSATLIRRKTTGEQNFSLTLSPSVEIWQQFRDLCVLLSFVKNVS